MEVTKSTADSADTSFLESCEMNCNTEGAEVPKKKRNRRKEKPKNKSGNAGEANCPEEKVKVNENAAKPENGKKKKKKKEKSRLTDVNGDDIVYEMQTLTISSSAGTVSSAESDKLGFIVGEKNISDTTPSTNVQQTSPKKKTYKLTRNHNNSGDCSMKPEHTQEEHIEMHEGICKDSRINFKRQTRTGLCSNKSVSRERQPNCKPGTSVNKSIPSYKNANFEDVERINLGIFNDVKNGTATCTKYQAKGQKRQMRNSSNGLSGRDQEEKQGNRYEGSQTNFRRQTRNGTQKTKSVSGDRRQSKKTPTSPNKSIAGLDDNSFEEHVQRDFIESLLSLPGFVKGALRINQRNYRESYICSPDGGKDILIDGVKYRNRALEGDEVVVQIFPPSQWKEHEGAAQKTGKVVHILTLVHVRKAVGTLKRMQSHNTVALLSPRDSRIPRIRIPLKECPKDIDKSPDQLFLARITEWKDVRFASGTLLGNSIGIQGDIDAETQAILLENEISSEPYGEEMFKYFPKPPYKISQKDLKERSDFRKKCIFTIDPATARDLDDAMSCECLANGNYLIGVHISDVSHFLKENTPLDKAVAQRATTTYLVQSVYHMLPREMTMMCSLLPGVDKLAFSVLWEITPDGNVLSHQFTRSVINSCAQLSYEHAQTLIDDPIYEWKDGELPKIFNGWSSKDIADVVNSLNNLALIMRKRRFDSGALRIDQKKLSFSLDSSGMPVSCTTYANKESHRLIEEFMLLANITVATALKEKFPKLAFLRCHDPPLPDLIRRVKDLLEKVGIILDTSSAGTLQQSLKRYDSSNSSHDAARAMALYSLCSKPMTRARYFCAGMVSDPDEMQHYALNVPLYTHFTSPIRRYADVMVHRLLSALIGLAEEPRWIADEVHRIAANCNKQKFNAKKAGEQSSELFFAVWVGENGPLIEEAIVLDVKDHSFDALICSTGTNVRVYTDKLCAAVKYSNIGLPQLELTWAGNPNSSTTRHQQQIITMLSVVTVVLRRSATNLLKVEAVLQPPWPTDTGMTLCNLQPLWIIPWGKKYR